MLQKAGRRRIFHISNQEAYRNYILFSYPLYNTEVGPLIGFLDFALGDEDIRTHHREHLIPFSLVKLDGLFQPSLVKIAG